MNPEPSANDIPNPIGSETYAALDLGTNNCRLLIAKYAPTRPGQNLKVIDSFSRIVRLGEDVSSTGNLSDAAMERTMAALRMCKSKLDRHDISYSRFVATEACRQARNAQSFLKRVENELDIAIEIITTEEEAKLAFTGCASLMRPESDHAIVFDIGGGSTEFLWVKLDQSLRNAQKEPNHNAHAILDWLSLPSGVMNLSEQAGGNRFVEMYFNELVERIMSRLKAFNDTNGIAEFIAQGRVQLLSTSGTVTTLAAIHLDLPRYDRARIDGIHLPVDAIQDAIKKLLAMRPSERFNHPCIGPERTDFIMSGCAIFEAIARLWPVSHITIADRGVREGIILSFV